MKKLLFLVVMLCFSSVSNAIELNGNYVSQSGELLFRFTNDSLYIDIAQSKRNVSAFKLVKKSDSDTSTAFNAFEIYLKNGVVTYREVLIRVSKTNGEDLLLEYYGKDKDREYNSNERYNIKKVD